MPDARPTVTRAAALSSADARRAAGAFPVVPLAGNLSLGVAVLSYRNALTLGITADTRACPDVDVFAAGLDAAFVELGAHWTSALVADHAI